VQPIDTLTSKAFQAVKGLCDAYDIKIGYCKCARMRFHSARGLLVLRICAVAQLRTLEGTVV